MKTPFDSDELDQRMEAAGMDVLLVTSQHNLRYLLGHPPIFFFEYTEVFGTSKYQPVLVYPRGRPADSFYAGFALEGRWRDHILWVPQTEFATFGTRDAMSRALEHVHKLGRVRTIGIEEPVLSADAFMAITDELPAVQTQDATKVLQELRSRKSEFELNCLRTASEGVLESMVAVLTAAHEGMTKYEVTNALAAEEVSRGLAFKYCMIAAGADPNRAPSGQILRRGDIISVDSGGTFNGYLGDIARMGVVGEPDPELEELLAEVDQIQTLACAVVRPGALGREITEAVQPSIDASEFADKIVFDVHGIGLTGHEVPNLMSVGSSVVPTDRDRPLEAGMMVSIETALVHPTRGFIKLEDAVAVTQDEHVVFAAGMREWHRGGSGRAHQVPRGHAISE